ncbi:MAG: histidine--tRNA ligase [Candidatus Omnitrophota bacterium]|jgi:histidyl-tRNA synthetase
MLKKFSVPRGTSDILPADTVTWQSLETVVRKTLHTYGYKEIRTPVFEETGLFIRSIGATTDVVQKQMLQLAAQGGENESIALSGLALRPEGTVAIARAYIENNFDKLEPLSKLYYIGPMFRGERPQKGRLRQFHQIGVEAMGPQSGTPYLDAEVISLSVRLLERLGLKDFRLKINSLGTREDKAAFSAILRTGLQPSLETLCADCRSRYDRNVFRILDCKNKGCKNIVQRLNISDTHLSPASRQYFQDVCRILDGLGVRYERAPAMVRGLDYYTHTVFEISDPSLGSQDALGAGGRYNTLVHELGGAEVDAMGFALGVERLLLAMPGNQIPAASQNFDVYMIVLDQSSYDEGFRLLHVLRGEGITCDMGYRAASMKSQMRQAGKSGARLVLIFGEDERQRGVVTLKDMAQGEQKEVLRSDLIGVVRRSLS